MLCHGKAHSDGVHTVLMVVYNHTGNQGLRILYNLGGYLRKAFLVFR